MCATAPTALATIYSVLGLKESQDYVRTLHTTVTTAEGTMGLMLFKTILNVLRYTRFVKFSDLN